MFIKDTNNLDYFDVDVIVRLRRERKRDTCLWNLWGYTKDNKSILIAEDIAENAVDHLIQQIGLAKDNRSDIDGFVLNP